MPVYKKLNGERVSNQEITDIVTLACFEFGQGGSVKLNRKNEYSLYSDDERVMPVLKRSGYIEEPAPSSDRQ